MAQYDITGLLADFQNLHPEIKLQIEETETTHLATVVPPKHPLSKKKQVSVSELRNENLLLLSKSTLHYDKITEICRQRGFEPRVIYTGTHMDNILDLVSKNHGISLLMQHAVEYLQHPGVVIISLKEEFTSAIALACNDYRQLSPAGKSFWNYVCDKFSADTYQDTNGST